MKTAEDFEADVLALVRAVRDVLKLGIGRPYRQRMKDAAEAVEVWYEQDDDPRSMGWVDDKGRP
jgi:hypothetical protein